MTQLAAFTLEALAVLALGFLFYRIAQRWTRRREDYVSDPGKRWPEARW